MHDKILKGGVLEFEVTDNFFELTNLIFNTA